MVKPVPTYQKLRGGYYTPKPIADFLANWAIQFSTATVLEPSCGDGHLLESAVEVLLCCGAGRASVLEQVHGVEIDPDEAAKTVNRLRPYGDLFSTPDIHIGDFFAYCQAHLADKRLFDVVIGNPPFIRYQNFPEAHRLLAFELMQKAGLNPNRLTNSWVPFIVATTFLLNEHGRIAMVVPAELLQVKYAGELRLFLSEHYDHLVLITFKKLVFEGIQQEVVLLLGERHNPTRKGIEVLELNGIDDLSRYRDFINDEFTVKEMDHSTEKWTMYFLDQDEIDLIRRIKTHPKLTVARDVIDVDVGIVTGLNKFFVLPKQDVDERGLVPHTQKIVGRSTYLKGVVFSEADWGESIEKKAAGFFLTPPNVPFEDLPPSLQEYVSWGEKTGANTGFKCRNRKRWYIVPSVWTPDAFMLRQIHHHPKIIVNDARATSTDTIHRVRFRNGKSPQTVAAAFLNSLSFAFSEVIGRSYGGGVLELEPNEAEEIPIPLFNAEKLDLICLDALIRANKIDSALDVTDQVLLKDGLGLEAAEIKKLRGIWAKLRDRRIRRK